VFEFDSEKSAANKAKHGIDFIEAQALWDDPKCRTGPLIHNEQRWMTVGMIAGKLWSAIITRRGESIRLISVRRSRKNEAKAYDRQND